MIAVEVSSSLEAKQGQEAVGDSSEAFKTTTSCDAVMGKGQKLVAELCVLSRKRMSRGQMRCRVELEKEKTFFFSSSDL